MIIFTEFELSNIIIFSKFLIIKVLMSDYLQLPPLNRFLKQMITFKIRKSFEYILYFSRSQQRVYSTLSGKKSRRILSEEEWIKIPKGEERYWVINEINKILSLQENYGKSMKQQQLLIISAQRFIIGLIITGHVHIYEIMIREFMPLFIKLIENQIEYPPEKQSLAKKIKQFCKETITILSIWFPKNFYEPAKKSWFKKAVIKYKINCKFIVYYTDEKIEEYQKLIQILKLGESHQECVQCLSCLQNAGKNYSFLKGIPQIPSTIRQQQEGSTLSCNQKSFLQGESKKDFYFESPKIDEDFSQQKQQTNISSKHLNNNTHNSQIQRKSRISQRIKKYRENRDLQRSKLSNRSRQNKSKLLSPLLLSSMNKSEALIKAKDKTKSAQNVNMAEQKQTHNENINEKTINKKNEEYKIDKKKLREKINQRRFQREYFDGQASISKKSRMSQLINKTRKNINSSFTNKSLNKVQIQGSLQAKNKSLKNQSLEKVSSIDMKQKIKMMRQNKNSTSRMGSFTERLRKRRQKSSETSIKLDAQPKQKSKEQQQQYHHEYHDQYTNLKKNSKKNNFNNTEKTSLKNVKSSVIQLPLQSQQFVSQDNPQNQGKQFAWWKSLFDFEIYTKLQKIPQEIFRKQCMKIDKKSIKGTNESWLLDIKCNSYKNTFLAIQLLLSPENTYEQYQIKIQNPQEYSQKQKFKYLFNFKHKVIPIIIRMGTSSVALPICMISLLKPLKINEIFWMSKQVGDKIIEEFQFKIDSNIFRTNKQIIAGLHLHQNKQTNMQQYWRCFQFFGAQILISAIIMANPNKNYQGTYIKNYGQYNNQQNNNLEKIIKFQIIYFQEKIKPEIDCLGYDLKKCLNIDQKQAL